MSAFDEKLDTTLQMRRLSYGSGVVLKKIIEILHRSGHGKILILLPPISIKIFAAQSPLLS